MVEWVEWLLVPVVVVVGVVWLLEWVWLVVVVVLVRPIPKVPAMVALGAMAASASPAIPASSTVVRPSRCLSGHRRSPSLAVAVVEVSPVPSLEVESSAQVQVASLVVGPVKVQVASRVVVPVKVVLVASRVVVPKVWKKKRVVVTLWLSSVAVFVKAAMLLRSAANLNRTRCGRC